MGSYNTVDKKLLEELSPDLILTTTGYQREFAARLSHDLPVFAVELPVSVAGIVDMVTKLGLILDRSRESNILSRKLLETITEAEPVRRRLKVYVEIDFGEPVTFGAFSYITDALRLLGVESIYGDQPCEWTTPDLGMVTRSDPDVIFYEAKMFSRFGEPDLEKLLVKRAWTKMRAVHNRHVFLTPGPLDFLAHHGPSFITQTMPWMRDRLEAAASSRLSNSSVLEAGRPPC